MGEVVYRPYRAGDEVEINIGFNRVFGLNRSLGEWRWKYPAEPEGRWIMLALGSNGEVVGHYGAVPVRLKVDGCEVRAGQPSDVFTRREARHGLAAARTYIATVEAFFAQYGSPERLAVLYGFPGERALRLGLARLGYDQMPPQLVPVWRRSVGRRGWPLGRYRVRVGFDPAAVDALWERSSERYPVSAVRNAAWVSRRFLGRPGVEYVHLTAWCGNCIVALAVLRMVGDVASWAELVWDGEDPRALAALDRAVVKLTRVAGGRSAEMWLGGDEAAEAAFTHLGWERGTHSANLVMVARSFHPEINVTGFAGRFYLTMSDADLV
jgi:hypothetical protein